MPKVNAVFKGGGVKGIAHVGALAAVEAKGFTCGAVAGTSAGAITAALVAAGFSAQELKPVLFGLDFNKFKDGHFHIISLLRKEGLYKGQYVIDWLEDLFMKKTGKQLARFSDLEEQFGIELRVVATDVTRMRKLVFPDDLADYGFSDPKSFPVSHAVRASMSIPFYFEPYELVCPDGSTSTLVDGGMLSNFPISLFDPGAATPQFPTFGFALGGTDESVRLKTDTVEDLAKALVSTVLEAGDHDSLLHQNFERSIDIPTGNIGTTEFNLTEEQKEWLYNSGYQAAAAFLADAAVQNWLAGFAEVAAEAEAAAGREP